MKFTTLTIITLLSLPLFTLAADVTIGGHKVLVGIPGLNGANPDFNTYVTALYVLSISIAALLAVIKIIIAGVKLMMTDIVPAKGEAKKDIQGALIGLLVVIAAVLILIVINPNITNVNLTLQQVPQQTFTSPITTSGGATDTPGPSMSLDTYDSNGVYSYISTASKDSSAFKDACSANNNVLVTDYQYYRCVKIADKETQNVDRIDLTRGTTYDREATNCTQKGGSGVQYDPMNKDYVYCVYPK